MNTTTGNVLALAGGWEFESLTKIRLFWVLVNISSPVSDSGKCESSGYVYTISPSGLGFSYRDHNAGSNPASRA